MSFQWDYDNHGGVGVLRLRGYLNDAAVPQFAGALRWVLARGAGAAALSLAGLRGWTGYGKQAVVAAAARFAAQRVRLALCDLQGLTNPFAGAPATSGGDVAVYPSLADALAGLARRA